MTPQSEWILAILDEGTDAPSRIAEIQDECLGRFQQLFQATMINCAFDPRVREIADDYNALSAGGRARALMSGELVHLLSKLDGADLGEESAERIAATARFMRRERAIERFLVEADADGLDSLGEETVWSGLGNLVATRSADGWRLGPTRQIGGVIHLDFDSPLATAFEARSGVLGKTALPIDEDQRDAIEAKLGTALAEIDRSNPLYGSLIRNFTRRIIIRKSAEADEADPVRRTTSSEHVARQPGCIRFLNPHLPEKTIASCMESLLHESIHVFITALENCRGPYTSGTQQLRPVSPWSGNLIPNSAYCHAVFIYYACRRLFERSLALQAPGSTLARDLAERMQHFTAGFLVDQPLSGQLVGAGAVDPALLAIIGGVQRATRDEWAGELAA